MPWKETCAMDERAEFVRVVLHDGMPFAEACRYFGVSRKTGYKWFDRFRESGIAGLRERSHACLQHPNAVAEEVVAMILSHRKKHPRWGARTLLAHLESKWPRIAWPVASTIGEILRRHGLTRPQRAKRYTPAYTSPFVHIDSPNAVWSADFKGTLRLGDRRSCTPLTITDNFSRFIVRIEGLDRYTELQVRPIFESAFGQYGLPTAIRTDNGSPFASRGAAGLTRLSVWWTKLGIRHERIAPGKPTQNGRHERMHRTLKQYTASPPATTMRAQQRRFDEFRVEYNEERPHQALQMKTPASVYTESSRSYPVRDRLYEYPSEMEVRMVRHNGEVKLNRKRQYLCEALAGERIGLEDLGPLGKRVHFGPLIVGTITTEGRLQPHAATPKVSPINPV